MGTWSWILALGAGNGLVLSALLWTSRGGRPASRFLAALIALLAWRAGMYILGYAGAYDAHRCLTFFPFDLSLAYGPLLWCHVVALTRGAAPPRWAWHLAPAALQTLYLLVAFALPVQAKWAWYTGAHLHVVAPLGAALALASAGLYLARSVGELRRYRDWLDSAYADRDHARLVGLRGILVAFALALAVAAAFALTSWLIVPLDYHARFPLMLAFALLTYCLGFLGWRNCFVTFPRAPAPAPEPAPDSGEAPRARREQAERLAATVRQSGWWRDPELDLASLAARLALSERTLSRLLGEGLGKSFREFVGGLRVDAVAADLDAGDGRALLEIALAAGFQSKASFNRVFLAHRGMTPSAYRRRNRGQAGLSTRQIAAAARDEAT